MNVSKMRIPVRKVNRLFLVTVVIPTLLAAVYFGLIASDVYISESRFVVRSPQNESASTLGIILESSGFSRADDDAAAVQSFIVSRDAARALDEELGIKKLYSDPSIDIFSRFSGLDWDDSFENFNLYYQDRVGILLDAGSSIGTLTVRAYSPRDAYSINLKLLEYAETLVNKLNERGRQDMIRYSLAEVADLGEKAKAASLAVARYRDVKGVINPEKQSDIPLQQIAKLQGELINTKGQILQIEGVARDNPQLPTLRQRAGLLEREIESLNLRVAGGGDRSLAGKAAEFERLELEKEFADKMLASAMTNLEQARNEAQRQQIYLERIVQPSLPDEALEPRRLRQVLSTFLFGLVAFGVLTMVVAGVKEHAD